MQRLLALALMAAPAAMLLTLAPAAEAQNANYRTRTVVVFGDDACPVASNPDEIIVCARRPEEERYRIPKAIRDEERAEAIAKEDNVAANRAALVSSRTGATGTGSCSTVGGGGITGCTPGLDIIRGAKTIVEGIETAIEPTDK